MSDDQPTNKTVLDALLEEARARTLSLYGGKDVSAAPDMAMNYGRNFENYGRNFENYGRNFENYGRNFENYGRNFENGASRDWGIDPAIRLGSLPDGTGLPPNAATIGEAIRVLKAAGLKDTSTLAAAAALGPTANKNQKKES